MKIAAAATAFPEHWYPQSEPTDRLVTLLDIEPQRARRWIFRLSMVVEEHRPWRQLLAQQRFQETHTVLGADLSGQQIRQRLPRHLRERREQILEADQ